MRASLLSLLCVVWLSALGCTVVATDEAAPSVGMNQCERDSDCAAGSCVDGICSAASGSLSTVLFEVIPPADAEAPGVRFLKRIENLSPGGGVHDIELSHVARVTGHVTSSAANERDDCRTIPFYDGDGVVYPWADNGDLPVRVILTPSVQVFGLSTATYIAEALPALDADNVSIPAAALPFSLNVPPGQYEIYVQTLQQGEIGVNQEHCVVPPQLYRRWEITSGGVLNLGLNAPLTLDVTVDLPVEFVEFRTFSDWTVDVLDEASGRPLSNKVMLGDPTMEGDRLTYHVTIPYSQVLSGSMSPTQEVNSLVSEQVRLAPPEDVTAPTIIMARWALDLYGDGAVTINQLTPLPRPVQVEGVVQTLGAVPEGATVTLFATEITGLSEGIPASFVRTVEAVRSVERPNDPPKFNVELLPGKYTVRAVPPAGSGLASTETTWDVGLSDVQAGKVIELEPEAILVGTALDPTGGIALDGASVNAIAVSSSTPNPRAPAAWGVLPPFAPRATTAVVDAQGAFELRADPGAFDLSVRPSASSGFAWRVQPNVVVSGEAQDLGELRLPLPIVYQGAVTVPATGDVEAMGVPNALIRAYVFLNKDGYTAEPDSAAEPATSLVQIAETRADDRGFFKLLVPSHLHTVAQ